MDKGKSYSDQQESLSLAGAQLTISVKEARKLLGKDFKVLTDTELQDMIVKLDLIAKAFITQSISI